MSLYKRSNSPNWYFKLYSPETGSPLQGSTGTTDKVKAQEFHDRLKADLWNQAKLGHKPRYLWEDAVIRYVAQRQELASLGEIKGRLRWLNKWLKGKELSSINAELINKMIDAKLTEPVGCRLKQDGTLTKGRSVRLATVNRLFQVLAGILHLAVDLEWLDRMPKIQVFSEPKQRICFLTRDESKRLLFNLPSHLEDMAQFTLETGLRRANVTGLEWSQIDLERRIAWIHTDQAKASKAIPVPLSDTAIAVLERRLAIKQALEEKGCQESGYKTFAFVYRGKRIKHTSTKAWYKAVAASGLKDFRWHDLRHTWASWHSQGGTPDRVLKELGGWASIQMVHRYAHLNAEHLVGWVRSHT